MSNKGRLLTVEDCDKLSIGEIKDIYKKNVSPSLLEILDSFSFSEEIIMEAQGVWLTAKSGKKILDVTGGAGVLNLGHNPPEILEARIKYQKEKRMEVHKSFLSPYLAALSHNMGVIMPSDLNYSYFCNSGAEAVEGAVKMAYKYHQGKRDVILHADIAFHGKLIASGNLTHSPGKTFKFQSVLKRDSFSYGDLDSLRKKVRLHGQNIYAIIVEPYSATHLKGLDSGFLKELRKLCDELDIVLIFDEVYTGWYKTGPLLSFMHTDIIPDIVTLSKSLGGGKSSISAYVSRDKVMRASYGKIKDALLHTSTYNGFAEECITAIESINLLCGRRDTGENALRIERKFLQRKDRLKGKYPTLIEKINGRGALQGIYLSHQDSLLSGIIKMLPTDLILGENFAEKLLVAGIIDRLFEKHHIHSLFMTAGKPALLFSPSLVMTDLEIDLYFDALEDVLAEGAWNLALNFTRKKFKKYFKGP